MPASSRSYLHKKTHYIIGSFIEQNSIYTVVLQGFIILTFCRTTACQFDTPPIYIYYQENVPAPATIGSVALNGSAAGVDHIILNTDDQVTALPGNPLLGTLFALESNGTLIAKVSFDREIKAAYTILVSTDEPYLVEIVIRDLNDNAPTFHRSSLNISISENAQPNDQVATLGSALDPDKGINSTQRYEIHNGSNGMFKLQEIQFSSNDLSVILRLNGTLDYKTQCAYRLVIRAYDGAGRFGDLIINIQIFGEIDDVECAFSPHSTTVTENVIAGQSIATSKQPKTTEETSTTGDRNPKTSYVGIIAATVTVVAIIVFGVIIWIYKRRNRSHSQPHIHLSHQRM